MTDPRPDPPRDVAASPRRLERPPGDRYLARHTRTGDATAVPERPVAAAVPEVPERPVAAGRGSPRALAASLAAAVLGGVLLAIVGSIDLGPGLLIVAAFVGWAIALTFLWALGGDRWPGPAPRATVAATLGAASVIVGFGLLWAWSRSEGGVLGPLDYAGQRFGLLSVLYLVVAAGAAGLRAR